jgi:hypothetical protein
MKTVACDGPGEIGTDLAEPGASEGVLAVFDRQRWPASSRPLNLGPLSHAFCSVTE